MDSASACIRGTCSIETRYTHPRVVQETAFRLFCRKFRNATNTETLERQARDGLQHLIADVRRDRPRLDVDHNEGLRA